VLAKSTRIVRSVVGLAGTVNWSGTGCALVSSETGAWTKYLVYSGSLSSGTPSFTGPRRQISIVENRNLYNSTYLGPRSARWSFVAAAVCRRH
jgi:hypothetical protein